MHSHYPTPTTPLASDRTAPLAVYSPTQAAMGALVGGPVGLIYFLYRNFSTLGNVTAARKCLIFGALLVPALLALLLSLPSNISSIPFTIFYVVVARFVAEKYQLSKQDIAGSSGYTFKSNWNVLGVGLLCFLGSIVVIVGPTLVLVSLGLVR